MSLLLAGAVNGCAAHGPPEPRPAATASASATASAPPPNVDAADAGSADASAAKPRATSLACGERHCCAGFESGEIRCWGSNSRGELGDGTEVSRPHPVLVASAPERARELPVQLSAANDRTCARMESGRAWCWGTRMFSNWNPTLTPTVVPGLDDAAEIAVGGRNACVRIKTGEMRCWGEVFRGYTPMPQYRFLERMERMPIADVVEMAAGLTHTCARLKDGTIQCWGSNDEGELGNRSKTGGPWTDTPVEAKGLHGAKSIAAGMLHSCAITQNATVACWGHNLFCGVGGIKKNQPRPTPVRGLENVVEVALGIQSCARTSDGQVLCWGFEHCEKCAICPPPKPIVGLPTIRKLALGWDFACALSMDGDVYCWGGNSNILRTDGTTVSGAEPVLVVW